MPSNQIVLGKAEILEDLERVGANGHLLIAHGEEDIARLEMRGEVLEALDTRGIALGHHEHHLVLEDVEAARLVDEAELFEVVHLLLRSGDEHVRLSTLLDLVAELARRSQGEQDLRFAELRRDLVERLGERGRCEDGELMLRVRVSPACTSRACGETERCRARDEGPAIDAHAVSFPCGRRLAGLISARTLINWAAMDTAISAGVSARISSPIGR